MRDLADRLENGLDGKELDKFLNECRSRIREVLDRKRENVVIPGEVAEHFRDMCHEVINRSGVMFVRKVGRNLGSFAQEEENDENSYRFQEVSDDQFLEVRKIPAKVTPSVLADPKEVLARAENGLKFEHTPTKVMMMAVYKDGKWSEAEQVPVGEIAIAPTADRYGQTIFGGNRMLRLRDGRVALFRPDLHARRFSRNAGDLLMPQIPEETLVQAYEEIGKANIEYLPPFGKGSLYIAPGMRATKAKLGVEPNIKYSFTAEAIPVGKIFLGPSKLMTVPEFHRTTGNIKTSTNYASTFKYKKEAKEKGKDDILTGDDSRENVGELSSSNVFFVTKSGILVTPPLSKNILDGVTRDTILIIARKLAKKLGLNGVEERPVTFDELGEMAEAFSCGTGVTINSIAEIDDHSYEIGANDKGPVAEKIMEIFDGILAGDYIDDPDFGPWLKVIA